tara:strand:+ start:581 stop:1486 length:906 start_codon:yes stop_codon:yes gene_type:complete
MNYYKILNSAQTDKIEDITKKYKELAFKYHPDRNISNTSEATEKFKEINQAFSNIKLNHNKTYRSFAQNKFDFKHFTDKLINKGELLNTIINKAKNIDVTEFFNVFFDNIKQFRFYYDDIFSKIQTDDINVTINVELSDIFNNEEKIINMVRKRKCFKCYTNDLKFCRTCDNKIYYEQEKCFIVNCADQVVVFSGESNEEKNKKPGDIIIKFICKPNSIFNIINDHDILYTINHFTKEPIRNEFIYLDKQTYIFECSYPFASSYIIPCKGINIPYSTKRGNIIIKINTFNGENNNFKFRLK